jgi:putative phosphoribosyl transferase
MGSFKDRADGGQHLARELADYAGREDVIVIALPRGGVPVGFEVARALNLPLDVLVVGRLCVPGKPDVTMGAVAARGVRTLHRDVVSMYQITDDMIRDAIAMEQDEVEKREKIYRAGLPPLDLEGKTVILVDDGFASGVNMRTALAFLRLLKPAHVVVAVPTAQATTCDEFEEEVDDIVCALTPVPFVSVGTWYVDFSPTSDEQVRTLLQEAHRMRHAA